MNIQDAWKTIVANSTVEDAEFTYKTRNVLAETSLEKLPTMTIMSNDVKPLPLDIRLPLPSNDDNDPTETYPIDGDISSDVTMINNATVNVDANKPEMLDEFTITDSSVKINTTPKEVTIRSLNEEANIINAPHNPNSYSTIEIHDEIARGGMGVVLRGKQSSLKREIAIKKIINNEQDDINKKKFVMEARVTAFLDHPNIIPVHELGVDNEGNPLITMKLVRGKSWGQILSGHTTKEYSVDYVYRQLDILLNVCNALSYAHSKNIIHNDLKPANIMVGEFGEVFVMDWGIAVSTDKENAPTMHCSEITTPMGTPNYMAPELANGDGNAISKRTDTYLLGAILYHILMSVPPHYSNNIWESVRMASEGNIPSFRDDIPQELQDLCTKALQKNPDDRYQTMDEFKQAIYLYKDHRESIKITSEAYEFIKEARDILKRLKSGAQTIEELRREIANPYCPVSRALFGFKEALRIWPKNPKALKGEKEGGYLYFQIAIYDGDFNIAKAVLDKMKGAPKLHKKLEKKMQKYLAKQSKSKSKNTEPKGEAANIIIQKSEKKIVPQPSEPKNTKAPEKSNKKTSSNSTLWVIGAVIFVLGMFFGRVL